MLQLSIHISVLLFTGIPGENEALARKQMTSNFKGSIDESNIFAEEVSKNPIRAGELLIR